MIRKTYSFEKNGVVNDVYTLSTSKGSEVDVLTYGARIIRISMPDRNGKFSDLVVGCKTPEDYYGDNLISEQPSADTATVSATQSLPSTAKRTRLKRTITKTAYTAV